MALGASVVCLRDLANAVLRPGDSSSRGPARDADVLQLDAHALHATESGRRVQVRELPVPAQPDEEPSRSCAASGPANEALAGVPVNDLAAGVSTKKLYRNAHFTLERAPRASGLPDELHEGSGEADHGRPGDDGQAVAAEHLPTTSVARKKAVSMKPYQRSSRGSMP
jgi:cytochrome c1